jgi:hypothetical protein
MTLPFKITKEIDPADLVVLYELLENTKFKINHHRKMNAGIGLTMPMGIVMKRPMTPDESLEVVEAVANEQYPELYAEIKRIAELYDIPFITIQVNKNYETQPHFDTANWQDQPSYLFSLGDYEGGQLNIEDDTTEIYKIDANCRLVQFNGSRYRHWNEPHTGTKYSLVFYYNKLVVKNIEKDDDLYPECPTAVEKLKKFFREHKPFPRSHYGDN